MTLMASTSSGGYRTTNLQLPDATGLAYSAFFGRLGLFSKFAVAPLLFLIASILLIVLTGIHSALQPNSDDLTFSDFMSVIFRGLLYSGIELFMVCLFAGPWIRTTLAPQTREREPMLQFNRQALSLFWVCTKVYIIMALPIMFLGLASPGIVFVPVFILKLVVLARATPMFVVTALGKGTMHYMESWHRTSGNTIKIVGILLITIGPFLLLTEGADWLYQQLEGEYAILAFVGAMIMRLISAAMLFSVSVFVYQELNGDRIGIHAKAET